MTNRGGLMKFYAFALSAILSASALAEPGDWRFIGVDADEGRNIFIDAGTITQKGDGRVEFFGTRVKKSLPLWGEAEITGIFSVDCEKQEMLVYRAFTRNRYGEVIESDRRTYGPISTSQVGTVVHNFADYACNSWKVGLLPTVADRLKFQP